MSYDTVLAGVWTAVNAVAGTANVYKESPFSTDPDRGGELKLAGRQVHYWIVSVAPISPAGYLGGNEPRWRVRVEGKLGVSREAPDLGEETDATFARLVAAVTAALSQPTLVVAGVLEFSQPNVSAVSIVREPLGDATVLAHRAEVTLEAQEE